MLLRESAGSFDGDGSGRLLLRNGENSNMARLISFCGSYLRLLWECFVNIVSAVICKRAYGWLMIKPLLGCHEQNPLGQPSH